MNELEQLKARAEESRKRYQIPTDETRLVSSVAEPILDDLDRAIAIAEFSESSRDELQRLRAIMCKPEHDRWRIVFIENQRIAEQRDQARADVRKLRQALIAGPRVSDFLQGQALADTAHYEEDK